MGTPQIKRLAALALTSQGWDSAWIAEALGLTPEMVRKCRAEARRRAEEVRAESEVLRAEMEREG